MEILFHTANKLTPAASAERGPPSPQRVVRENKPLSLPALPQAG
jgi:hypothetical protein